MGFVEKWDNEIIVTLPNTFKVRFWVTGLSDEEYIKRAEKIYKLECKKEAK